MKQSMVVVNKAGGAGAEGFLDVKAAKGDPHKIVITLSNAKPHYASRARCIITIRSPKRALNLVPMVLRSRFIITVRS